MLLLRGTVTYVHWELLIKTVITRQLFPAVIARQSSKHRKGPGVEKVWKRNLAQISSLQARRLETKIPRCFVYTSI